MKKDPRIGSRELDLALRPGLESLRAFFNEPDELPENETKREKQTRARRKDKVDAFLKGVGRSGQRISAENNEVHMVLRVGKATGVSESEFRPLFDAVIGRYVDTDDASSQAIAEPEAVLAIPESTSSTGKRRKASRKRSS